MSKFWILSNRLKHVLDIHAYDHVLFLIALLFLFLLVIGSVSFASDPFTIGHTTALMLSVLEIVAIK
jgi:hypothetical protein